MNNEFNNYMQLISGQEPQTSNKNQIDAADCEQIVAAFLQMFNSLAAAHWMRGNTLGAAWYKALQQTKQFIMSKNPDNPVIMYLRQVFAAHRANISRQMMTSPHRDDVIKSVPEKIHQWNTQIATNTTSALNTINTITAKYNIRNKGQHNTTITPPDVLRATVQKIMQTLHQNYINGTNNSR